MQRFSCRDPRDNPELETVGKERKRRGKVKGRSATVT